MSGRRREKSHERRLVYVWLLIGTPVLVRFLLGLVSYVFSFLYFSHGLLGLFLLELTRNGLNSRLISRETCSIEKHLQFK